MTDLIRSGSRRSAVQGVIVLTIAVFCLAVPDLSLVARAVGLVLLVLFVASVLPGTRISIQILSDRVEVQSSKGRQTFPRGTTIVQEIPLPSLRREGASAVHLRSTSGTTVTMPLDQFPVSVRSTLLARLREALTEEA